jgi:hypothetical protein
VFLIIETSEKLSFGNKGVKMKQSIIDFDATVLAGNVSFMR